jgi:hypothetical protein
MLSATAIYHHNILPPSFPIMFPPWAAYIFVVMQRDGRFLPLALVTAAATLSPTVMPEAGRPRYSVVKEGLGS